MAVDTNPGGVALRLDITPSEHPSMIQGDGPGAHTAKAAMGGMYLAHGAIIDLGKAVKDKTQIGQAAIPHCEAAISKAGAAQEMLTAQIVTLGKEIATAIKGNPTPAASEIRAYWAKQKTPIGKLGMMFHDASKHPDTVAAILGGPAYLSGLTPDNMAMLRDQAAKALVAEKHAMIAETRTALGILDKAVESFTEKTTAMLNKWQSKDAAIIQDTLNRKAS